ncbi:MAG: hypothetical protein U0228_15365 [Myxococcaceae bacterium]
MTDRELRDEIERLDAELRRLSLPPASLQAEIDAVGEQCTKLRARRDALVTDEQEAREAAKKLTHELHDVRGKIAQVGKRSPFVRAMDFLDQVIPEIPEPFENRPPSSGCAGALALLVTAALVAWGLT